MIWPVMVTELRGESAAGARRPMVDARASEGMGGGPLLVCRACDHAVTRRGAALEVAGAHEHTFANPAGIVFRIGCFAEAACTVVGTPTLEHTWFAGHRWAIAHCAGCGEHLGWRFASATSGFFGLILDRLVERDED